MDPITLAIYGALGKLSETVIADSYQALKAAIAQKCGVNSDVAKAIDDAEKKPESPGRKETLKEEITNAKIDNDPEVLKLANTLIEKVNELDKSGSVTKTTFQNTNVSGGMNIQAGKMDVGGDIVGGSKYVNSSERKKENPPKDK